MLILLVPPTLRHGSCTLCLLSIYEVRSFALSISFHKKVDLFGKGIVGSKGGGGVKVKKNVEEGKPLSIYAYIDARLN